MESAPSATWNPRRPLVRGILRRLSIWAFALLTDLRIVGRENIPREGPLLVVANHFNFADPVLMLRVVPWRLEFLGGAQMPFAPRWVTWIPKLWGFFPVHRGTASRDALRAAEAVLQKRGVLGMFPEGGSWATVLRPPRPGAAYLAVRTGARILPMGFDGVHEVFRQLRQGRRARITVRIGQVFGPFEASGRGEERRRQLDAIGHEIMQRIAALIPPERRGYYSDDPSIREAAKGIEVYPWDNGSLARP